MITRREGMISLAGAVLTSLQSSGRRPNLVITSYGAVGDGESDDTDALIAALSSLRDGDVLDLQGLHLNIFVGVDGSRSKDAIPLSRLPRLKRKKNVTIQNGIITADRPRVSRAKLRYPTTLTIDGCENVALRNLVVHSKGENFGDTDASSDMNYEERRAFAAQNGGHAILIVRSRGTSIENCRARLCGSVGAIYVMSSHDTAIESTFSNPGSHGYAAFAFDSWAGNNSFSGFAAHIATMINCSSSSEGFKFGSKGCVVTEDADVAVYVDGGYFADAYPNGGARDIGFAFGCSSSRTIVRNAIVENCAMVGYTGTTNKNDFSYLEISNVIATGLRKTVHQTEATSIGRMYWNYDNVTAKVTKGGTWVDDSDLSRKVTSYLAMPNAALRVHGSFVNCRFSGAMYGIVSTTSCYGRLHWLGGTIETRGFLWDSANIGSGSPSAGRTRGIQFEKVSIVDVSGEEDPYFTTRSQKIYTHIDLSTSTISLSSVRPLEARHIARPDTFLERYALPKPSIIP